MSSVPDDTSTVAAVSVSAPESAPKVSVIIPVYNTEKYLRECLNSVLNQSLRDIEIICVDDGSTDSSPQILEEYAARDSRVKILRQQNKFAGVARNNGMKIARGEYVHFLDADDYVLPFAYEAIFNKAKKYDLDMLRCAAVSWNETFKIFEDNPWNSLSSLKTGDFMRLVGTEEGSPLYCVSVTPWTGIYRRAFLEERKLRFVEGLRCRNDRSFFAAVTTNAKRTMITRDRLVFHRTGQKESLLGLRARNFDCLFRSIDTIADRLESDGIDMPVRERVLSGEFKDLSAWLKKFCNDEEYGTRIREQLSEFLSKYKGPFPQTLKTFCDEALSSAKKKRPKAEKPFFKEVKVFREACDAPKVSVVVPIYNVEDYLNEALHSLAEQQLEDIEFICVNDGSTDNSLTILKEYAALDRRFRILDGPNGGYGKAMNRGMDAARGEYMGILEPDDFIPPEMYSKLYAVAAKHDVDFVKADFCRFTVKKSDGALQTEPERLDKSGKFYNRVVCPIEATETFMFIMNTWSGIYRLEFLRSRGIRHNETPGASFQDNGFWFQTFCCAKRAFFVNKAYYMNRRDNPNSSVASVGKMYCMTEEYRFIKAWLDRNPEIWRKVGPIFCAKKYFNFITTYRRLIPAHRQEYLRHMRDEFKEPLEHGLMDRKLLGKSHWQKLNEIVADPDAYCAKIRVSVIVPVYNAEKYLRQMLDSIVAQTLKDIEIICVDDGSTDGSLAILREYQRRDPDRVRVVTQNNAGAGAARNNGMQYACGEYLSFLDSDDFFEPNMLEIAYERAHSQAADVIVFRCDQYLEETARTAATPWTIRDELLPPTQPFSGKEIPRDIFKAFVGWAWDKLFRAEFVREQGLKFQELRTTNDMFFVFSAITEAKKIVTFDKVLAHHRRVSGTLSVTRERSWNCFYKALCAVRDRLAEQELLSSGEQDFVNYSLHASLWNLSTLHGPAYYALYEKLKTEWFADLGITAHGKEYFYNSGEWGQLQKILELSPDEFLKWKNAKSAPAAKAKPAIAPAPVPAAKPKPASVPAYRPARQYPRILVRLAALFIFNKAKRKRFREQHMDLNPRDGIDINAMTDAQRRELERKKSGRNVVRRLFNSIVPATRSKTENTERHILRDNEARSKQLLAELRVARKEIAAARAGAEKRLSEQGEILVSARESLAGTREELSATRAELASARAETEKRLSELFKKTEEARKQSADALAALRKELSDARKELDSARKEIAGARNDTNRRIAALAGTQSKLQTALTRVEGRTVAASGAVAALVAGIRLEPTGTLPRKIQDWYFSKTGKPLNLAAPKTYCEKMQWLKAYDVTPEKTRLTDKLAVREWVAEKVGEKYVVPVLGVWNAFDEIDFGVLPQQFVLKATHGSRFNIVVPDKSVLDFADAKRKFDAWLAEKYEFHYGFEMHYAGIPPRIIAEPFLEFDESGAPDWQVFCFNGKPEFVLVILGGAHADDHGTRIFYDLNWKKLPFTRLRTEVPPNEIPRPENLDEMLAAAGTLCRGFRHVCVDFFRLRDGSWRFAEMTFARASGLMEVFPPEYDRWIGDKLVLPTDADAESAGGNT